jgi:hypothetical protein
MSHNLVCHEYAFTYAYAESGTVMIVSYETLRTLTLYLANCSIGLLLCDEGHRLKNSGNWKSGMSGSSWSKQLLAESQTYAALNALNVKRRVILTGTPIQVTIFVDDDGLFYSPSSVE